QLAAATVFEIDHPSTQAYKRARTTGARSRAHKVTFVGGDFERDDLGARLAASGHEAGLPTMWIWEGVTPYLTPEALAGTLDVIGERSSPGSVLAMTYGTPDLVDGFRLLHPLVRPAFRLLGEPLEGLIETSAAMRLLRARGFEVEDDSGAPDWAARVGARRPPVVVAERLLVAEVRASSGRASPGRC
ncbi:MAG TPA: SAM-dependent methyltransferase, partial [Labilithrix sp.]|nr:SAM-dependent methyltransferase [Labilithrix sp.]